MRGLSRASRSTHALAALAVLIAATACEHASRPMEPVAESPVFARGPAEPPPKPSGVAWSSDAPPSAVPEIQGTAITLKPGERCRTFRVLPSRRFTENTLVQDACLRIPNDTTIEIQSGVTLAIVATNGLSVGTKVVFNARGARGLRGGRSAFASVAMDAKTDAEIRALCVDNGNQCGCPSGDAALASIRGRAGGSGSPGGTIRLVSPQFVSSAQLSGLGIDVSGGRGGPAGDSGTRECLHGALRCSSPACSTGVTSGADGVNGGVFLALGGAASASAAEQVRQATTPSGALVVLPLKTDEESKQQFKVLEEQAIQEGWQRRSGEDT